MILVVLQNLRLEEIWAGVVSGPSIVRAAMRSRCRHLRLIIVGRADAAVNWDQDFAGHNPITLPDGRELETLADLRGYIWHCLSEND
jgi:hypothetical protein